MLMKNPVQNYTIFSNIFFSFFHHEFKRIRSINYAEDSTFTNKPIIFSLQYCIFNVPPERLIERKQQLPLGKHVCRHKKPSFQQSSNQAQSHHVQQELMLRGRQFRPPSPDPKLQFTYYSPSRTERNSFRSQIRLIENFSEQPPAVLQSGQLCPVVSTILDHYGDVFGY